MNRTAAMLDASYGALPAEDILATSILHLFPGRIALVSSFGAEAAVLLHLVAETDRATPVVFIDTGKHFPETLSHRDALVSRLGLTDVRSVGPDLGAIEREDGAGHLWRSEPDRCCFLRKVRPLEKALKGFDAWISGRKRYQAATRSALPMIEAEGGHIKINPLAAWTEADVEAYLDRHDLPRHPLVARSFPSIGCEPCTARVLAGEDARAGRWRGRAKTECGIHLGGARIAATDELISKEPA